MWPILETIFLTAKYYTHESETCFSINSTTPVIEPICDKMMGYLPSYQQMIRPRLSVSLFDELLAKLWSQNELKYGVCHTGNDPASREFMASKWINHVHGSYLGDNKTTIIFKLEVLINVGLG